MRKMAFAVIFFVVVSLVMASAPLAFAQGEPEPVPTPELQPIYEIFKTIGYAAPIAVLIGLVTCIIGYLKSTPPEQFKLVEFIYTLLISLIIGIATIYGGWTYTEIEQWLGNGALTLYLYWMAKIIAKKLNWVQQATGPPATA